MLGHELLIAAVGVVGVLDVLRAVLDLKHVVGWMLLGGLAAGLALDAEVEGLAVDAVDPDAVQLALAGIAGQRRVGLQHLRHHEQVRVREVGLVFGRVAEPELEAAAVLLVEGVLQ